MHWEILDEYRRAFLPCLAFTKLDHFYLAGGTALALQLGHRDSIDFDFFAQGNISPDDVFAKLEASSEGHSLVIIQKEKNTLSVLVDGAIKLSFFGYKYPLLFPLIATEHFDIAGLTDIVAMKLSAITSRSLEKDYIDIYYLLKHLTLKKALDAAAEKLPELDRSVVLKALVYFDDITHEEILFKDGYEVDMKTVAEQLRAEMTAYLNPIYS